MAPKSGGRAAALLLLNALGAAAWLWVSTGPPLVSVCPGESALLRCIFTVDTPLVEFEQLAIIWRLGRKRVLRFENVLTVYRQAGAQLSIDELMKGNASLTLPEVDTADCGDYSCEVTYSGEQRKVYMTLQIDGRRRGRKERLRRQDARTPSRKDAILASSLASSLSSDGSSPQLTFSPELEGPSGPAQPDKDENLWVTEKGGSCPFDTSPGQVRLGDGEVLAIKAEAPYPTPIGVIVWLHTEKTLSTPSSLSTSYVIVFLGVAPPP